MLKARHSAVALQCLALNIQYRSIELGLSNVYGCGRFSHIQWHSDAPRLCRVTRAGAASRVLPCERFTCSEDSFWSGDISDGYAWFRSLPLLLCRTRSVA